MKKKVSILIFLAVILILSIILIKIYYFDPFIKERKKEKIIKLINKYYNKGEFGLAKYLAGNLLMNFDDDQDLLLIVDKILLAEKEQNELKNIELNKRKKLERQELFELLDLLANKVDKYPGLLKNITKNEDLIHKTAYTNKKIIEEERKIIEEKNIIVKNPEAEQYIKEGIIAYNNHNYTEAKEKFILSIKLDKTNPLANGYLGATLFELNPNDDKNIEEASRRCKIAVNELETFEIAHFTLAKIYNIKGLKEYAEEELIKTIKINPNNHEACFLLGKIYYSQGKYINAETQFKNAVNIKNDFINSYFYLSNTKIKLDKLNEAKHYLNEALRYDPNFYFAYVSLAEIYFIESDYLTAIDCYNKALIMDNNYEYYYKIGECYEAVNQFENALNYFEKIISFEKISTDKEKKLLLNSYEKIITIKKNSSKYIDALKYVKKGIKILNDKAASLYYLSGEIKRIQGNDQNAISDYINAIELNTNYNNDYEINYKLGLCYQKINKLNQALIHYEKSININNNYFDAHYKLGETYFLLKKYDKAKSILINLKEMNENYHDLDKVNKILSDIDFTGE